MKLSVSLAVLERSNTTGAIVPESVTEQSYMNPTRSAGTDDGNDIKDTFRARVIGSVRCPARALDQLNRRGDAGLAVRAALFCALRNTG
jgi:hypothetical protein